MGQLIWLQIRIERQIPQKIKPKIERKNRNKVATSQLSQIPLLREAEEVPSKVVRSKH